jgi:hypothetical protein
VKADVAQFRDAVFNFDAAVRKIAPPDAARSDYNALLEAARTTIAGLDAIAQAPGFAEVSRLLSTRVAPDSRTLVAAEKKLYDVL